MIVNEALADILNTYFRNGTVPAALYVGLVDQASFSALAAADTMASHPGWLESTAYSQSTRPQWSPPAAANNQVANSTVLSFTMNAPTTVVGIFLCTNSTKGGTSGKLTGPILFATPQVMPSGENLKIVLQAQAQSG